MDSKPLTQNDEYPIIPLEVIEMIVDIDPKPWYYVNKWYYRLIAGRLKSTLEYHEAKTSLHPRDDRVILRIYVNMCKYNVFDMDLIRRVVELIAYKSSGFVYALLFLAPAYHLSKHIVDLMPTFGANFQRAYGNLHVHLGYKMLNKTYDLRNDIVIEFAASRPDSVEFIQHYIYHWYDVQYIYNGKKIYQFRDCISIEMGKNICKLKKKKICETPAFNTPKLSKVGYNLLCGLCEMEMDTTGSLEKCIDTLKLQPGDSTNIKLVNHIYKYFVNDTIRYSQPL